MTLDLTAILVFLVAAVVYAVAVPPGWRGRVLLVGSVVAIFWLQSALTPRFADFIFPALTVGLAVAGWWLSRPPRAAFMAPARLPDAPAEDEALPDKRIYVRDDWLTLIVLIALVIGLSFFRYADPAWRLTAGRPPAPFMVGLTILEVSLLAAAVAILLRRLPQRPVLTGAIVVLVALFVALKWPPATSVLAGWWRGLTGQDVSLAAPNDLVWLGFSYVAFRLIHTLRDRQTGILPDLTLSSYVTYVLFAPSFVAGPIDRAERFSGDYWALPGLNRLDPARWGLGLWRLGEGLFKKFVIADFLAAGLSLTPALAEQSRSPGALWLLLFGYGLRLYFDFGGYTDIAIGLGILFGIRLPENFNRPYTRTNITAFWQSWHMTLSNWARFYVFTPLSRGLLRRKRRPSSTVIVLLAHLSTMAVIGLWHGITWTFLIWGLWHALGLFAHKVWSDRTRTWYRGLQAKPWRRRAWSVAGWALTFLFVMLGWVWFLMPDVPSALRTFAALFGA